MPNAAISLTPKLSASDQVDPHRHEEIDTIRGIVIVLVMLGSFGMRYQTMVGHLGQAPIIGYPVVAYLATQLFFAVSGYRRMLDLQAAKSSWHYAGGYALRYLPALWPSVALIWGLTRLIPGLHVMPLSALPANFMMAADLTGSALLDPAHWRLKVELLLSIVAGLAWFAVGRQYLAASLAGLLILAAASATWLEPVRHPGLTLIGALTLDGYLPHIVFGVALWQLVIHGQAGKANLPRDKMLRVTWLMLAACGCALAVMGNKPEHRFIVYFAFVVFTGAACGGLPNLARVPVLPWLGRISLPIFLVHFTPGFVLIGFLERAGVSAGLAMLAASLLSVALGAALHHWAERPAAMLVARARVMLAALPAGRRSRLIADGASPVW